MKLTTLVALVVLVLGCTRPAAGLVTAEEVVGRASFTWGPYAAPLPNSTAQWEYRIEFFEQQDVPRRLNELAEQGWEIYQFRRAISYSRTGVCRLGAEVLLRRFKVRAINGAPITPDTDGGAPNPFRDRQYIWL